jgi:hypothetical protein
MERTASKMVEPVARIELRSLLIIFESLFSILVVGFDYSQVLI